MNSWSPNALRRCDELELRHLSRTEEYIGLVELQPAVSQRWSWSWARTGYENYRREGSQNRSFERVDRAESKQPYSHINYIGPHTNIRSFHHFVPFCRQAMRFQPTLQEFLSQPPSHAVWLSNRSFC